MLQNDILRPQEYVYGDNLKIYIPSEKYPPSEGYVLTLTVVPVTDGPNFTIVSDPTIVGPKGEHVIQFLGSYIESETINPGDFRCQAVITLPADSTIRTTIGFFDLEIKPDFNLNYTEGYDPRSYNVKCLQALELVLSNQASRDLLEYTFKDATFKYKPVSELVNLRNYFQTQVEIEQGKLPGRYIVKTTRPTYWGI